MNVARNFIVNRSINSVLATFYQQQAHPFCTFTQQWTEVEYDKRAEETLMALTEFLDGLPERINTDKAYDISYSMGVLTACISPKIGTYVINKQTPNKQIWLSSPISGPKRYDLSDSYRWIYKHDGVSLHELLEKEFKEIYKTDQIMLRNLS
ncbi:hypothetical protein ACQ4LE_008413 [Meloidogyne hapla]|uniref:ferroxidase n=1 Tax=Meloidogyne hapla TaxID=6305 RepID=A0A1I8BTF0_MELHA